MKIVHCIIQYFPRDMGGTEVYTHTLAKLQKGNGCEVAVIIPHIEQARPGQMEEHYQYDGIDVYQFLETGNPHQQDLYTGKIKPEGLQNFSLLLQRLQPQIVHFHELNLSNSFSIDHVTTAKKFGARVFVTMHLPFLTCNTNILINNNKLCYGQLKQGTCTSCSYNTFFGMPGFIARPAGVFANLVMKTGVGAMFSKGKIKTFFSIPLVIRRKRNDLITLMNNVDKIIAVAEWYKTILLRNGVPESKISVIKQALAMPYALIHQKEKSRITKPAVKLVFVGRIQPQKGIALLIKAVKQFSKDEVTLDLYGKVEAGAYFKDCLNEIATSDNIKWEGVLARDKVTETISAYDLFCLPSMFSEMSPLVIQEAFAAGVPVLASKVYGNMEQVEDGKNGFLFEFNSLDSLKDKLGLIIQNPALLSQLKNCIPEVRSFNAIHTAYQELYLA